MSESIDFSNIDSADDCANMRTNISKQKIVETGLFTIYNMVSKHVSLFFDVSGHKHTQPPYALCNRNDMYAMKPNTHKSTAIGIRILGLETSS